MPTRLPGAPTVKMPHGGDRGKPGGLDGEWNYAGIGIPIANRSFGGIAAALLDIKSGGEVFRGQKNRR